MSKVIHEQDSSDMDDLVDNPKVGLVAPTPREPAKSILRAPRVTFPDVLPMGQDSIDQEDAIPEIRPRKSNKSVNRQSLYSLGNEETGGNLGAIFSSLVVLKIVFFDMGFSLADAVTDILQGVFLIIDRFKGYAWRHDTATIGFLVLAITWLPGIVAILAFTANQRSEYFGLSKELDKEKPGFRKARRMQFIKLIVLCFFFFPFVPTIGYMVNLFYLSGSREYDPQTAKLQLFARVTHSITGCIEAPLQMMLTSWLILREILEIPWEESAHSSVVTDTLGNSIWLVSIPMWTMIFSVIDILTCSMTINLFNVYIGQIRGIKSAKRYANLIGGHFPFFLNSIAFRLQAFSFFLVYWHQWSWIPLVVVWISNIIIGKATEVSHRTPKVLRPELKRMKSEFRENAGVPKIKSKRQQKKNNENTPVWLNSFLSIFVPSCFVYTYDPAMFYDEPKPEKQEDETEMERELRETRLKEWEKKEWVRKGFFKYEKSFQQKVIRYQVIVTNAVILICVLFTWIAINFTSWNYMNNRLTNENFNIYVVIILAMGIISYGFLNAIDIYDTLHLNDEATEGGIITIKYTEKKTEEPESDTGYDEADGPVSVKVELPGNPDNIEIYDAIPVKTKKHGKCKKATISFIFMIIAICPLIVGMVYNSFFAGHNAYVVMKGAGTNDSIDINMVKARLLNSPTDELHSMSGNVKICRSPIQNGNILNLFECTDTQKDTILIVDMNHNDCLEELKKETEIQCLSYKALILLENWEHRSSRPIPYGYKTKFPIMTVSKKDITLIENDLKKTGNLVNIIFEDFSYLLEDTSSIIYEWNCIDRNCINMNYPTEETLVDKKKYVGCDGNLKFKAKVNMDCTRNGIQCPELGTWEKRIKKDPTLNKEQCFGAKTGTFPPPECKISEVDEFPTGCNRDFERVVRSCFDDKSKTRFHWTEGCGTTSPIFDRYRFGPWLKNSKLTCNIYDFTPITEKYRFARKDQNCVMMEHKVSLMKTTKDKTCEKEDDNKKEPLKLC